MNAATERAPLVRPRFLKWSVVAFVLLLPFVVYSVWDYVEARRLNVRLDAITQRGEPLPLQSPADLTPEEEQAERLYRAAGAMTSSYWKNIPSVMEHRVRQAKKSWDWPDDVVERLRLVVDRHHDALTLADRAAALPFNSFLPGTFYNRRTADMWAIQDLCSVRATVRLLDGDSEGAVDSVYTALRTARTIESARASRRFVADVSAVVRHGRLSAAARARLAPELAQLDHDDLLKKSWIQLRVQMIERVPTIGWRSARWEEVLVRPWMLHRLNRSLDVFSALVIAADRPWPEPLTGVPAVGSSPFETRDDLARKSLENDTRSAARQIKDVRCARLFVSDEQLQLIDPFTGKKLEVVDCTQ